MAKYLNPKADLTFKRVFGEHKDLAISFLNALLQFKDGSEIVSIEYQTSEMLPDTPTKKYSIVDVKCNDDKNRQFIVEMQMVWTPDFKERILHNTTKAYSSQLEYGKPYKNSMPVYSLCLIDDTFRPTIVDEKKENEEENRETFYHNYKLLEEGCPNHVIEGLNIVLVELPKFKPKTIVDKKMMVLWLRYLTEINEQTETVDEELLSSKEISKALSCLEQSAYTKAQMEGYEKFWDDVVYNRNFDKDYHYSEGEAKGRAEGLQEGRAEGRKEGLQEGRAEGLQEGEKIGIQKGERQKAIEIAKSLKSQGVDAKIISEASGLTADEIEKL